MPDNYGRSLSDEVPESTRDFCYPPKPGTLRELVRPVVCEYCTRGAIKRKRGTDNKWHAVCVVCK